MPIQYAMQVFEYENSRPFRIYDRNGEPWFVLSDVCRELEIANVGDAASRLDDGLRHLCGRSSSVSGAESGDKETPDLVPERGRWRRRWPLRQVAGVYVGLENTDSDGELVQLRHLGVEPVAQRLYFAVKLAAPAHQSADGEVIAVVRIHADIVLHGGGYR